MSKNDFDVARNLREQDAYRAEDRLDRFTKKELLAIIVLAVALGIIIGNTVLRIIF